ncbi:response regulator [Neisseriaceae bacterium TC5R-5]|nr:response regulator [Neisseriaceae bacterium TC5R-5]
MILCSKKEFPSEGVNYNLFVYSVFTLNSHICYMLVYLLISKYNLKMTISTLEWAPKWLNRPRAVYHLLFSLAVALSLLLLGWFVFYVFIFGSSEVSHYRRDFNENYLKALDFFDAREAFLLGIRDSIYQGETGKRYELYIPPRLDGKGGHSAIDFPPARARHLSSLGGQLLLIDPAQLKIINLQLGSPSFVELSKQNRLVTILQQASFSQYAQVRWEIVDQSVYLLMPYATVESEVRDNRWLALKFPFAAVLQAIKPQVDTCCKKFVLRNKQGETLMSSSPELSNLQVSVLTGPLGFSVTTTDGVVRFKLKKQVNQAGWTLSYFAELPDLFHSLRFVILIGFILYLVLSCLLFYLVRLLDKQVLRPAQFHLERLGESDSFSREVIDLAPIGLCVLRITDGSLVRDNVMAREWLNGEYQGLLIAAQQGDLKDIELQAHQDRDTHLHATFSRTRFQGEHVLLCALSNISARKQTENALAEAKQFADEANRAKSEFLARMSHEIRTPLYGVLGNLELLALSKLDRSQKQQVQTIQRSAQSLLHILNDILDLSKIEAGQLRIESHEFSLPHVVENTIRNFAGSAKNKGLRLYLQIEPSFPHLLLGDALRIQQILANLLGNAIKFTQQGAITIHLKSVRQTPEVLLYTLDVVDTGVGISTKDQARLFEPFMQADQSANRHYNGTGLGLPICLRLAKLMAGELQVTSKLGYGSSFSLTMALPVADDKPWLRKVLTTQPVTIVCDVQEHKRYLQTLIEYAGARVVDEEACQEDDRLIVVLVEMATSTVDIANVDGQVRVRSDAPQEPECIEGEWYVSSLSAEGILDAINFAQNKSTAVNVPLEAETSQLMPLRALVAEDNPANQLLLRSQLERLGCVVTITNNGKEALEALEKDQFDCILTDINMPVMDGYVLTRTLRNQGAVQPIFGVTASAMPEDAQRCREAGMTAHLAKPVSIDTLRAILQEYCSKQLPS